MSIRIPDPQVLANQAGAWKNATDETKESIMKQVRKIENPRPNPCHGTTVKGKACGGGAKKNGYCGVHQDQAVCSSCDSGAYLEAGICRVCEGAAQIHEEKEAMMNETCIWCGGPATCRDPHCPGDMTEALEDNDYKEEPVRKIKCANCKQYHDSIEEIKGCSGVPLPKKAEEPVAPTERTAKCGVCKTRHPVSVVREHYANRYNKEVK